MYPPAAHARHDGFVVDHEFHHVIDGDAHVLKAIGLSDGAREAVEQEAVAAVVGLDAFLDQAEDDVIRYQEPGIHDLLGFQAQRRAGADRGAQHVAGGNLGDAEFLGDGLGLGAFSRTRGAQKDDSHDNASRVKSARFCHNCL